VFIKQMATTLVHVASLTAAARLRPVAKLFIFILSEVAILPQVFLQTNVYCATKNNNRKKTYLQTIFQFLRLHSNAYNTICILIVHANKTIIFFTSV